MLLANWLRRIVVSNVSVFSDRTAGSRRAAQRNRRSISRLVTAAPEQLERRALLTQDFGDAPAVYPVTLAEDGARHTVGALFLGAQIDIDADGIESADATGDGADDDGVSLDGGFLRGVAKTIQVTASQSGGLLHGWIDWNADGDWTDLGEHVFADRALAAGVNTLTVHTPPEAVVGNTFARFRLSTDSNLSVTGAAIDGEVEDYQLRVVTSGSWALLGPAGATGGQVEGITNRPVTGPVEAVLAHPTDPDILYIGAVNGGVWKTTNATAASPIWTPLTDTQASPSIHSLTFDLNDPTYNTIYAGIGRRSSYGGIGGPRAGLMRSTDGGQTWQAVNGAGGTLSGKSISSIYANGNTVVVSVDIADSFIFSNIGVFRSTDGGATFTRISGGSGTGLPEGVAYQLAYDPVTPSTLYTSSVFEPFAGAGKGIYKSTDSGATWTLVSTPAMTALVTTNTSNIKVAVGRSHEVYAAIVNSGTLTAVFRSPDSGANWTQMDTPVTNETGGNVGVNPGGQGSLHFSILADPTNANIVYIGGDRQPRGFQDAGSFPNAIGANDFTGRLFRGDASKPAGNQFVHLTHRNNLGASGGGTASNSAPGANSRDMTFDANGNLLEVNDRGIYRRTSPQDNTGDWFSMIGNLAVAEVHDAAWDSLNNVVIAGTEGTGVVQQSSEDAAQWVTVTTGSGGDVAVDNLELAGSGRSVRYSSFQNLGAFTRRVFNAAGQLVSTSFPSRTVTSGSSFVPNYRTPIQTNSVVGARLLIQGNNSLYESLDGGATLREIGLNRGTGQLDQDALWYGGSKDNVVNPDLVWAASGSNVLVRTSGTGAVTLVTSPTLAVVRDLAVNSRDWANAFIVTATQVFATNNTGSTWSNITGNLTSIAGDFRSMAFVPGEDVDTIIVGTGSGIFATNTAAMGTWYRVGNGMPNALAYELDYDASDDVLIAGTMGRGVWKLTNASIVTAGLAVPTLTVTAPDQAYNNAAFVPTVSVTGNNAPEPTVTLEYYSDAAGQNVIAAPENVGTYYVRAFSSANSENAAAQSAIVEFDITPFTLTGSITVADKDIDGTTSATILTRSLDSVFPGDDVTYTGGTATFDTAAFGSGKTVTATGLSLTGADAGNYTVNSTAVTTATIRPVAKTPSVTGAATDENVQTTSGLVISRNPGDGPEVSHFQITNILNGLLFLNDGTTPVNNGDFITFAQGNAGLRFTPASGLFSPGTLFSFDVQASVSNLISGLGGGIVTALITVSDVNQAPTAVTLQNTTTTLAEDASTASAIKLADIVVTDDLLGTNDRSLSGADAAFFEIVGNELRLIAGTTLDFETKSSYSVTVEVNDATVGGAIDASQNFTLNITDVNEAPTAVLLQNTTTSLAENTSTASAIKLADIVITDDVLGTNDRSLSGADAAFFEIVGNELRLIAGTTLDFETKSSYTVTVEVNDATVGGAIDASQSFTLSVLNLLDTTTSPDAFVLTYTASDVTITHSVNGGPAANLGKFPLTPAITLNGLDANDSVRVVGTAGNDVISVSSTGIFINGTGLILNGPAARTLAGAAGNDTYEFDADTVLGLYTLDESGGGSDTIDLSLTTTAAVTLHLGTAGTQVVQGANLSLVLSSGTTFENAVGTSGSDTLTGNVLGNSLDGRGGNDTLNGFTGSDTLTGGAGDDTYVFGAAGSGELDTLIELSGAGSGIDTLNFAAVTNAVTINLGSTTTQLVHGTRSLALNLSSTFENVLGGSGNDRLTGNALANILSGRNGNDTLNGFLGNDSLAGGAGDDSYVFGASAPGELDTLTEASDAGSDTLDFAAMLNSVTVNLGMTGSQLVDGARSISLNQTHTFENLLGGSGDDLLTGGSGNNILEGRNGNDTLNGFTGSDTLTGGAGDDTYLFGAASSGETDVLTEASDAGSDTLNFGSVTASIVLNLATTAAQTVHTDRTIQLSQTHTFENAIGGSGDDMLTGGSGNNLLDGRLGNDTLNGFTGSDTLIGGLGDDTYVFSLATPGETDRVEEAFNQGTDTLSFSAISTGITVNLSETAVQLVHTDRSLVLSSGSTVENVLGGSGDDIIFGNSAANELRGNSGNDLLVGLAGNDTLNGGPGFDVLVGGRNQDVLQGSLGEELLISGFTRTLGGIDDELAFLLNVQSLWAAPAAFNDRVLSLTPILNSGTTVRNDSAVDTLSTNEDGALDWIFAALTDGVTKDVADLLTLL